MNVALITTCTNRKQGLVSDALAFSNMAPSIQSDLCRIWARAVKKSPVSRTVEDTYCGRGFQQAKLTALALNSTFRVISAGLGLVSSSTLIPAYNATLTQSSPNCIARRSRGDFNASKWWQQLNKATKWGSSISDIVSDPDVDLVLITLTSTYASLVFGDLDGIKPEQAKKVRIIGLRSANLLPEHLQTSLMPYDERFDGPDGEHRGTRSDFPQRTTRHFAEEILAAAPHSSHKMHAQTVHRYLADMRVPTNVSRRKMTDDEIVETIKLNWFEASGSSSKMLRLFRDDLFIACEQKRFATLFNQVRKQGTNQ